VDFSAEQLAFARRLADRESVRIELREGDLADLAFLRAETIDLVFSAYAFGFVEDLGRVFRQVHRVLKGDAALVFSALPHGASAEWVGRARDAGAKVVDLSADLRPGNSGAIPAPYGLPELTRAAVAGASVVANPGCYATAILLALLPLLERGLIAPGATIAATAASGVTGAGFTPRPDLLFAEVAEDYRAYGVGNGHRHLNELRAVMGGFGSDADLIFTPHLLPVARGILATITVPLAENGKRNTPAGG